MDIKLDTTYVIDSGLCIAKQEQRHGLEVFALYLLPTTSNHWQEQLTTLSKQQILTKLNQLIRKEKS